MNAATTIDLPDAREALTRAAETEGGGAWSRLARGELGKPRLLLILCASREQRLRR